MPIAFWALGMMLVFAPFVVSGLAYTLGDLGDGRLVAFTLEHGYRWIAGHELHRDVWKAPMFHPYELSAVLTDVMLGFGPLYWPWRMLGLASNTAFQLWLLAVWSLNFAVACLFVVRFVRVGALGASVGAFVFAFGNPRLVQYMHAQLAPQFYVLAALLCLHALLARDGGPRSAAAERLCIGGFFAALVGQAYGAFYTFYFFGLALAAAALWTCVLGSARAAVLGLVRRRWAWLATWLALSVVALLPLATRYLAAAADVGGYELSTRDVPVPMSWLLMGPGNLAWGWVNGLEPFRGLHRYTQSNGIGPVTTAVCLVGLVLGRRAPGVRLLLLATGTVALCATMFGDVSAWRWVQAHVPGGSAIRSVGRIGMIVMPLAALGIALGVDRVAARWHRLGAAVLVAAVLAEQLHPVSVVDKHAVCAHIDAIAERVDPDCEAFFLVCTEITPHTLTNDEAIWAALRSGRPTVNGHSGNNPPGWRMNRFLRLDTPEARAALRRRLDLWCKRHGLDAERVQWIEVRGIEVEPEHHVLGVRLRDRS